MRIYCSRFLSILKYRYRLHLTSQFLEQAGGKSLGGHLGKVGVVACLTVWAVRAEA